MKAIIIAGGFGTRLRPLTYNTPKAIMPVANVPFLLHQIELIKKYGIKEVIINLHYLSDSIKKALRGVKGVKLYYSIEKKPLGTAGAVKNAEEFFDDEPMVVFNGDILTDLNLRELINFHKAKKAKATLTLARVEDPTTYGLVLMAKDKRIKEFIEKPNWERVTTNTINAGIYVLDPKIFREVPFRTEYSFERQLFPKLLQEGKRLYGYETAAYWLDIGNPVKYMEAHRAILRQEVEVKIGGKKAGRGIWVGEGAKKGKGSKIFAPAIIGKRSTLGAGSKIHSFTVIGDNVTVGERSVINHCVIWSGTEIGDDVKISDCIIGGNCEIGDGVTLAVGSVLADGTRVGRGSQIGVKF